MNWIQRILGIKPHARVTQPPTSEASVIDHLVLTLAPQQPPRAAAEQFADKQTQAENARVASLYRRVVATNNRNVTRDYGKGPVDETRAVKYQLRKELPMTPEAFKELEELGYGIAVTELDPEEARKMYPKEMKDYAVPRVAVLQAGTSVEPK